MKYNKEEIDEIVNADGELIGGEDVPTNGANLSTAANNVTDYNAKVSHQPYRYDMLGRFGFTLLPFFEGVEDASSDELIGEIAEYFYDDYMEMLKYYYKNPKLLQQHYRMKSRLDFESDDSVSHDIRKAGEILELIKPHFEKSLKALDENLKSGVNEGTFIEGKMLDNKVENDVVAEKSKDNELSDTKLKKIAGLLNNEFDQNDLDKLITLLENK